MGIALTTAGVTVGYCVEVTAGTRPTTGYIELHDVKSIPSLNPEPENLETTTLAETEFKTYTTGLKDLGGSVPFLVNFTNAFIGEWDDLIEAYEAGIAEEKATWFEVRHPKLEKSVFFTGQPSKLGLPEMSVDSVLETEAYIVPTNAPDWYAKSTNA